MALLLILLGLLLLLVVIGIAAARHRPPAKPAPRRPNDRGQSGVWVDDGELLVGPDAAHFGFSSSGPVVSDQLRYRDRFTGSEGDDLFDPGGGDGGGGGASGAWGDDAADGGDGGDD